ncbi:sugar transporter [Vitreoscilla massiliensis]|uniref:Sugar transporter n=1 Tax=Vitreoscilla massiliensis TaxID=1689272 RepID=A0ABY4E1K3_9NEIS|nr:sugar transporter [Vitreoscilla massiliensis]UOO89417.1 sugar transporter [Vitreoscilla massiliensis]
MSFLSPSKARPEHSWFAVITLSIAAFIFNTTEFVPVGLLPNIAASFDMDVAHTGLIMTVYAWAVTLFSLPLTMLSARFERRGLLAFLFVLFVASHVLAACAWNFTTLLMGRLGIAAAHAVFWAITIPMAVRLAPEGKKAKALSLIVTGSSLATVLGVPLGTVIGQHLGWRVTFGLIGGIAALILVLLLMVLPRLPSTVSGSFSVLPKLLKRPTLVYVYATLALMVGAHFTAYTYVSPFLHQVGGMSDAWVVAVLFVVGIAGILGGIVFARNLDSHPLRLLVIPMGLLLLCLLALHMASLHIATMLVLALCWGMAITILGMVLQNKVLEVAPDASDIGIAMFSGVYNIGIGGGALLGGQVILHLGLPFIGYIGSVLAVLAVLLFGLVGNQLWLKAVAVNKQA